MRAYAEYQARYAHTIRESDKVLIELVRAVVGDRPASLLDMGCSTGNLLGHLCRTMPNLSLTGADIVESIIAECRADPRLEGVEFLALDALDLDIQREFDVVVANAVLMFFAPDEFEQAVAGLGALLRSGGLLVAFDFFHPFDQEVAIVETSASFPEGLRYFFRSESQTRRALEMAGLVDPVFRPFSVPLDLERPRDRADISTWTVRTDAADRLSFRGTVFQPWCHLTATVPRSLM